VVYQPHISLSDAQAWLETTKANLTSLDSSLEQQVTTEILAKLADTLSDPTFGTPTWVDRNTTPEIVRQVIAMYYAGWFYDRQYSEVLASEGNSYGLLLRTQADLIIAGIISSSILITEILPNLPQTAPVFYPTDASSTLDAQMANSNPDDKSIGPSYFQSQKVF
jgi:hypothetical protein